MTQHWFRPLRQLFALSAPASRRRHESGKPLHLERLETRLTPAVSQSLGLIPGMLPSDVIDNAYNQTISPTGATGNATINVTNIQDAIPGFVVPASGTNSLNITGTPTATGTESFTVTAIDSAGHTATANYSVTVTANAPITLTSTSTGGEIVNTAYSQTITASGGTGNITLSISNIQNAVPGLVVPASGTNSITISGTPTATGTETFLVTATDSAGDTTTSNYSLVTTIDFTSGTATHYQDGDPDEYTSYTQNGFLVTPDVAADGPGAHFHIADGALYTHIHDDEPGGAGIVVIQRSDGTPFILNSFVVPQLDNTAGGGSLTFTASNGQTLTVTATGTYDVNWGPITSFTITPNNLLDSLNQGGYVTDIVTSSQANYAVTVNPPITFSPSALTAGSVNSPYNQNITATGGTGNSTLTVSNIQNAIPGLVVPASANNVLPITGTPAATGTESFTVTTVDTEGNTTTANYSITVTANPPITLTSTSTGGDIVNTPYSQTITASGGSGSNITLTVSDIQNAVPGLVVPASGINSITISGTPTTTGTETFLITATDSAGDTTTSNYSLLNTIAFTSGTAVHLTGGDPDEYTSYTQDGFVVTPDVAVDGPGAHFHIAGGALYTHIHDDEPGGPGVVVIQRSDGAAFILNSFEVPELDNTAGGGSLTITGSNGQTLTVTAPGTYTVNWGPITLFTITPNNLLDSLNQAGYVTDIVTSSPANYAVTVNPDISLSPSALTAGAVNSAYNQTITASGGTGNSILTVSNIQNAIPGLVVPASGNNVLPITGTPTASGTESFTVTTIDTGGNTMTTNYTVTVNTSWQMSGIVALPTPPAPLATPLTNANAAFIDDLYSSLLGRHAESAGLTYWEGVLQSQGQSAVVQGILNSTEYRTDEVISYYQTYLGRTPSASEVNYWVNAFQAGETEQQVVLGFVTSAEYESAHASRASFVTALYQDVLGRTPAANEVTGWVESGLSESAVAQGIINSSESLSDAVYAMYGAFLDRSGSSAEVNYWLGILANNQDNLDAVMAGFLTSPAFNQMTVSGVKTI